MKKNNTKYFFYILSICCKHNLTHVHTECNLRTLWFISIMLSLSTILTNSFKPEFDTVDPGSTLAELELGDESGVQGLGFSWWTLLTTALCREQWPPRSVSDTFPSLDTALHQHFLTTKLVSWAELGKNSNSRQIYFEPLDP